MTNMTKTEAKKKLQAGEIQIYFDDKSKLKLLNFLCDGEWVGQSPYYLYKASCLTPSNLPIIKISEIIEDEKIKHYTYSPVLNHKLEIKEDEQEVVWKYYEIEYSHDNGKSWSVSNVQGKLFRLKKFNKQDLSKEIDALNKKAKENGMKAVVTFEKI